MRIRKPKTVIGKNVVRAARAANMPRAKMPTHLRIAPLKKVKR
jgi:hypothetical protein